ncbi:ABC transporter ATP-binding protein [Helicovermis profundi]|uniref:ABC transporter ATP-binding protein n=1 Tax=Helicovermis profundi TaxID=3065157 RepID=A0AAU9E3J3_9FIRM|nr:ABC transporter ATP-binding protein [Clostridia bacterium S502]
MNLLKKAYVYTENYRNNLIISYFAVIFSTIFYLLISQVIRISIDILSHNIEAKNGIITSFLRQIINRENFLESLLISSVLIVTLTIIRGVFTFLRSIHSNVAAEGIAKSLRDKLYGHISKLNYEYHIKASTGDTIQRCTSDINTVRRFLALQSTELFNSIFMFILVVILMFNMNVKMTFIGIVLMPIIVIYSYYFSKKVHFLFTEVDESEANLSTALEENISGVRVVRAFGMQAYEIEKFDLKNKDLKEKIFKLINYIGNYWSISSLIALTQNAVVLIFGAFMVVDGKLTLGTLVAFTLLVNQMLFPIRQVGRILGDMSKAKVSIGRIEEILDEEAENYDEGITDHEFKGYIEFKNVNFSYDKRPILKNISFTIKPNEKIAILGTTGSGKSTLMYLLTRLYSNYTGTITLDGIDIKKFNKHYIRKNIGLILQEPFLFAKTIQENISVARPDADFKEIELAADISSVHSGILEFDKGYETLVGEKGVSLSGGQKQRISIARKVLTDAKVIIFDDSLSAVDIETDMNIRNNLKNFKKDATTILISHRISTLKEADKILVLENGEITAMGDHNDLLKISSLYKKINDIQKNQSA